MEVRLYFLFCMYDFLLTTNDLGLLHETKKFLPSNYEMKDTGETSYVIGIEIFQNKSQGLCQKSHINKVLERFRMEYCSAIPISIQKRYKFSLTQYPKNHLEWKQMEAILYASVVGSIMYAQICTRPNISFIAGMLGRYQINSGMEHRKNAKKVLRYL